MENSSRENNKKTVGSVIKAIEIMDLLASSKEEIGATEISNMLNQQVSGTYHILNTLKLCNIIEQNPRTKRYRLGLKLWKIGKMAREQNHLSLFIQPYLKELRNLTNETANLTILDNAEIVYIAQEESTNMLKMFTRIGARAPLYCSAAGKVLLAFQSQEKQNAILQTINFQSFTEKTIKNPRLLKEKLVEIQNQGYGHDDEERELGVSCIAVPVFDFDGEAIAAVSISGPTSRFTDENKQQWIKILIGLSKNISKELGFRYS